ncbi:glutamate receptor ionotropic, delta-1 [Plakobranchus ocellatus]|uniref:Glutamate receptor ionotropic, delta-1 n=1 Tax=Plakobranchus ocellatus TaxID=259542 RepID=A0AAV3YX23_9GAST|nr:glutamate receptor ionotropic, delta-1 [Plakobranchus ocellatus]
MYDLLEINKTSSFLVAEIFLFIYTADLSTVVRKTDATLSFPNRKINTIVFEVKNYCSQQEVLKILLAALDVDMDINGVIVASSNVDFVTLVLDTVATEPAFKWRRLRHTIEWIAMTKHPTNLTIDMGLFRHISLPDFVTFLFITEVGRFFDLGIARSQGRNQLKLSYPLISSQRRLRNFKSANFSSL